MPEEVDDHEERAQRSSTLPHTPLMPRNSGISSISFENGSSSSGSSAKWNGKQISRAEESWNEAYDTSIRRSGSEAESHNASGGFVKRRSGGFLLRSPFTAQGVGQDQSTNLSKSTARRRGKIRTAHDNIGEGPAGHTTGDNEHIAKSSGKTRSSKPASSPLAKVVTSAASDTAEYSGQNRTMRDTFSAEQTPSEPSPSGLSAPYSVSKDTSNDPTHIVRLALNLSESRRTSAQKPRSYSQQLLTDSSQGAEEGRKSSSPRDYESNPGNSPSLLRQQRERAESRHIRNTTPLPLSSGTQVESSGSTTSQLEPGKSLLGSSPKVSAATLARVAEAKASIELRAQFKELLEYLPPLEDQVASKRYIHHAGKGSAAAREKTTGTDASLGACRQYNPLQCMRNRRLRYRAGVHLKPYQDGWNDVQRVQDWMLSVSRQSCDSTSESDLSCLPTFPSETDGSRAIHSDGSRRGGRSSDSWNDWTVSPAELLADTYWLERNVENKRLLRSNKVQSSQRARKRVGDLIAVTQSQNSLSLYGTEDKSRDLPRDQDQARNIQKAVNESSTNKQSSWRRFRGRSASASSSSSSSSGSPRGRRHRSPNSGHKLNGSISATLDKHVFRRLYGDDKGETRSESHRNGERTESIKSGEMAGNFDIQGNGSSVSLTSGLHRPDKAIPRRSESLKRQALGGLISRRASINQDAHGLTSSEEFDTTAPNSPQAEKGRQLSDLLGGFVPSMMPYETPPRSRNPSPAGKINRTLTSKLPLVKSEQEKEKTRDFGPPLDIDVPSKRPSLDFSRSAIRSLDDLRPLSPTKKSLPKKTESSLREDVLDAGKLRRGSKGNADVEASRLRGLFKGTKVEELFRTEVSRIGELLWRKEDQKPHDPTSQKIYADSAESDTEGPRKAQQMKNLSSPELTENESVRASDMSSPGSPYGKYMGKLPTFTSHWEKASEPLNLEHEDHISRQQLVRQQHTKSPRMDALAPPRLDTGSASPSSAGGLSPIPTRETQEYTDVSGNEGDSRYGLLSASRAANARLNTVLGLPGQVARQGPPITGLAGVPASDRADPHGRSQNDSKVSASLAKDTGQLVSSASLDREFSRVNALLLSSGIKAKEILKQGRTMRRFSVHWPESWTDGEGVILSAPGARRQVTIVNSAASKLDESVNSTDAVTKAFRDNSVPELLKKIDSVRDRLAADLTVVAQQAADEADELSRDLTTRRTLEVKQLNDSVDLMMRRRRPRLRRLRKVGFIALEWSLLGVMWMVWFTVVIIRLVRGVTGGITAAFRWLFWL